MIEGAVKKINNIIYSDPKQAVLPIPSYRTFGYFINEVLADSIEEIFQDILIEVFLVSIGQNLYKYRNKQKKVATAA